MNAMRGHFILVYNENKFCHHSEFIINGECLKQKLMPLEVVVEENREYSDSPKSVQAQKSWSKERRHYMR